MVQGVFYRAFTKESALELGLVGWARNLSDGKVEVVVEGNKSRIKEFLRRLRQGPPASKVDKLSVEWEETKKEFSDFRVLR